jgi:hypothetical protein
MVSRLPTACSSIPVSSHLSSGISSEFAGAFLISDLLDEFVARTEWS